MKKKTAVLALVLALLIALAAGIFLYLNTHVEEKAVYVPGQTAKDLIGAALDAGKIVTGDMTMHLDVDASSVTGMQSADAIVDAALSVLDNTHLRFGFGLVDRGFRLELGAAIDNQSRTASASVEGAANVTLDGLSVESDMIPGQRVSAQWETLMRLAGLDEQQIEALTNLRDAESEEPVVGLQERLNVLCERFSAFLEPYEQIVSEHIEALPKQVENKVPAQNDYPAVAKRITATVVPQDIASLINDLIDRAEADGLLAFGNAARAAARLREQLDIFASRDCSLYVEVGLNDEDLPLFIDAAYFDAEITETTRNAIHYVCTPSGGTRKDPVSTYSILFDMYVMDDQLLTMGCDVRLDPSDPVLKSAVDIALTAQTFDGDVEVYNLEYSANVSGELGEDGLPLAKSELHQVQTTSDSVRMVANSTSTYALTADGGERNEMTGTYDMTIGDSEPSTFPIEGLFVIAPVSHGDAQNGDDIIPGSEGITGNMWVSTSMPASGINAYQYNIDFASKDYDPSATEALEEVALETASTAQMDALYQTFQTTAMQKAMSLLSVLPPSLMTMMLFM